jgi:hypothetical protein
MIAAIITPVKDKYMATFAVHILRSSSAPIEYFVGSIKQTQSEAEAWTIMQYRKWLHKEVVNFCKQRMSALLKVGAYSREYELVINRILEIRNQRSLTKTCGHILQNQDFLRWLVPAPNSAQYYWYYTIEDIIHCANDYLLLGKTLKTTTNENIH